ncbi:regulatory protein RecX [Herbiconiux sp. P15]|uniref:regulatory protein RecX n=1 Tax=Herbiconiux liukaitaii TaxID=3342799 RepID=UPI0035B72A6B
MNDIVSLDSVRRGRQRSSAAGSAAEVTHPVFGRRSPSLPPVQSFPVVESAEPVELEPPQSDEERLVDVSDTVVRALGRRQLSAGETHDLLVAQGATSDEADVLVAKYEEFGYLNDFALAESLVERLSERNHKSRAVISRELAARKIPSEMVTEALSLLDDDHEFDLAHDAAMKRIGQLSSYDDTTAERRLMAFLTRRGFGSGVVREVTRQAMATRKSASGPRFR